MFNEETNDEFDVAFGGPDADETDEDDANEDDDDESSDDELDMRDDGDEDEE